MPDDQFPLTMTVPPALHDASGWIGSHPGLEIWAQTQTALVSGTADIVARTHAFRQAHLLADCEACKSLMACRHPAELVGVQQVYLELLATQYREYVQDISVRVGQCVRDMTSNGKEGEEV